MPQRPKHSTFPNGKGESLGMPEVLPASPTQPFTTASTGSRSSRTSRSKRSGSSVARRRLRRALGDTQKRYAPHVCCFAPYRPPTAAVLDPFPNLRINAICMTGLATLVTVHRSGVRLYRERHFTPTSHSTTTAGAAASTTAARRGAGISSGVFEQVESRSDFQVRESYLCTAMQPVLLDGAVLLSKWSRYFCVASGNDRVVHSVAVMSTGAHFCLHHERHQTNKVVCMHCTQVATVPFHPFVLKPAVVSVDEVGMVVLFDVEREAAVVLEKAPLWFQQSDGRVDTNTLKQPNKEAKGDAAGQQGTSRASSPPHQRHPQQVSLLQQRLNPEEEERVVDTMEKAPVEDNATYHLDHGVATRVTLVGPCLELCNHCHNAFMSLAIARGYTLVSIYVCSRAHDVPPDNSGSTNTNAPQDGGSIAAELNVVLLRVLWGPRRAFVLEEVKIVQEAAPTDVCEAGVATTALPYQVGLPMTLLLARPALTLWQLRACTGERIDTRSLCRTTESAKSGSRHAVPPRAASEFFIHWVPLGRHRLTMQSDDRVGPQSWFCIAAVTDDNTVLLLGQGPRRCAMLPASSQTSETPAAAQRPSKPAAVQPLAAREEEPERFKDADLEGWLDDLNTSASPSPSPPPPPQATGEGVEGGGTTGTLSAHPYTVLMNLHSPSGASSSSGVREAGGSSRASSGGDAALSVAAGALSVMADLHDNRLVFFKADEEALLTVPLPFVERVATLTDDAPAKEEREVCSSVAGPATPEREASPAGAASTAADGSRSVLSVRGVAETVVGNGYSQYLWGATNKAISRASQGWSSSVQKWAPSSSSHFFAGHSTPRNVTAAASPPPAQKGGTNLGADGAFNASAPSTTPSASAKLTAKPANIATTAAPFSSSPVTTASAAAASHYSFSIIRPLMAAVFHLNGEDKEPLVPPVKPASGPTTPDDAVDGGGNTGELRQGDVLAQGASPEARRASPPAATGVVLARTSTSPPPLPAPASLPPSLREGLSSSEHGLLNADARSNSEASTAATTATTLAVPIHVAHGGRRQHRGFPSTASFPDEAEDVGGSVSNVTVGGCADGDGPAAGHSSRHRRHRGAQAVKSDRASAASSRASPELHTLTIEDGAAQASYMERQMALLAKDDPSPTTVEVPDLESARDATSKQRLPTVEKLQFALRHLVDVDEPLERNTILYSWEDGHNDLYIRLSAEQDALERAAAAAPSQDYRSIDGVRLSSPRRHLEAFKTLTHTSLDASDGVHSVGFLSVYHSVVARRAETASYGNCFNYADYFTTLQVPQHVLDAQERDKCQLELEDLRLQQARDMAAVHPYAWMTVYQNEERRSTEAEWRLHSTFPYDDERDGRAVDLNWLNRTAGNAYGATTPEWRWATEKEVRVWAEEEGTPQSRAKRQVRSLVKELKDWCVGPWEYAERWPSRDDSGAGDAAASFVWSAVEAPSHRCRRRRLTRLRVSVAELQRQTELTEMHIRELEVLREELGL
ncbi:hypothetical protein N2W54_005696 [Lotmaria passim]